MTCYRVHNGWKIENRIGTREKGNKKKPTGRRNNREIIRKINRKLIGK